MSKNISIHKMIDNGVCEFEAKIVKDLSEVFDDIDEPEVCQTINDYLSAISDLEIKSQKKVRKTNSHRLKKNLRKNVAMKGLTKYSDDFLIKPYKEQKFKLNQHTCQVCDGQ